MIMTDEATSAPAPLTPPEQEAPIPFKLFLETVQPCVERKVSDLWLPTPRFGFAEEPVEMSRPELRLHCTKCEGERNFRFRFDSQTISGSRHNVRCIH